MDYLFSDTVVGAATGSFITLFGVWLTNFYQAKARKEDREHHLKSEIYMLSAEQLMEMKLMLVRLPNMSQEEMNKVSAQGMATAKLTVVAKSDTVQAVNDVTSAIAQKFLTLLPEKLPLDYLKSDIQILTAQLEGTFQKQNQMLNEMIAFNLRGDSDSRLWKVIQDNFNQYSAQIAELVKERELKSISLNSEMKGLMVKCIEAMVSITDLEIRAIACIRSELNMPFDEDKYRKTIEATNLKMREEFNKFLVSVPDTA